MIKVSTLMLHEHVRIWIRLCLHPIERDEIHVCIALEHLKDLVDAMTNVLAHKLATVCRPSVLWFRLEAFLVLLVYHLAKGVEAMDVMEDIDARGVRVVAISV